MKPLSDQNVSVQSQRRGECMCRYVLLPVWWDRNNPLVWIRSQTVLCNATWNRPSYWHMELNICTDPPSLPRCCNVRCWSPNFPTDSNNSPEFLDCLLCALTYPTKGMTAAFTCSLHSKLRKTRKEYCPRLNAVILSLFLLAYAAQKCPWEASEWSSSL